MQNIDPTWIAAAMQFKAKYTPALWKKRGIDDWKDALKHEWHDAWDDINPDSDLLRKLRNYGGLEWLENQPI